MVLVWHIQYIPKGGRRGRNGPRSKSKQAKRRGKKQSRRRQPKKKGNEEERKRGEGRRGGTENFRLGPSSSSLLVPFRLPVLPPPQEKKFFPLSVAERGGGEGLKGSLKFGVRREGRATIHNFDAQRRATGEERRAALLPPSFLNPPFFLRPSLGLPACTQVVFGTRP